MVHRGVYVAYARNIIRANLRTPDVAYANLATCNRLSTHHPVRKARRPQDGKFHETMRRKSTSTEMRGDSFAKQAPARNKKDKRRRNIISIFQRVE